MAEGLLIILINKATKLFGYFLTLKKEYIADLKLGVITDTRDLSGKILIERKIESIDTGEVLKALDKFKGKIRQTPPAYSSVKYKGKPSYRFARKGQEVELKPKTVNIYNLELISFKEDLLRIKINCSSGTYIRSLAYDIGNLLGTGASLKELKRTWINDYSLKDSINVDGFIKCIFDNYEKRYLKSKPYVVSLKRLLGKMKNICIRNENRDSILNGWPVTPGMIEPGKTNDTDSFKKGSFVSIWDNSGNLLAIHEIIYKKILQDVNNIKDEKLKLTKSIITFSNPVS